MIRLLNQKSKKTVVWPIKMCNLTGTRFDRSPIFFWTWLATNMYLAHAGFKTNEEPKQDVELSHAMPVDALDQEARSLEAWTEWSDWYIPMNTLMYDVNKKTTKKLWHKDVFQIFSGHLPNKNTESTCISLKAAPCTVHSLSWNKTWTHDLQVAVSHTIDIDGGHSWGWIFYLLPEELAHGKLVPIRRTFGFTFRYTFSYRQEQHGLLKKLCIRGCIGLLKNKIKGPKINSSNNMWLSSC